MVLELKAFHLKMMTCLPLVIWMMHIIHVRGVFGDEVKIVSVMEGDSVTLHTDATQIQKYTDIEWTFAGDVIAKVNIKTQQISYNDSAERLRDRLKLDNQTGSLTITNTRTTDSGDYILQMYETAYFKKIFRVTIYEQSPGTGSCQQPQNNRWLIISGATLIFLIVAANVIFCIYWKHVKAGQQVQTREEDITYADPTFIKQKVRKARIQKEVDVVYAGVAMSN